MAPKEKKKSTGFFGRITRTKSWDKKQENQYSDGTASQPSSAAPTPRPAGGEKAAEPVQPVQPSAEDQAATRLQSRVRGRQQRKKQTMAQKAQSAVTSGTPSR